MAKPSIRIGEELLPGALNMTVLARAYKEKDLKTIWETYKNARLNQRTPMEPTEAQIKYAKIAKQMGNMQKAARDLKVEYHVVHYAVRRVAIWEYLNK